jgi:FtsP/CotA-like multicopper oxidase with cupredoxin domain
MNPRPDDEQGFGVATVVFTLSAVVLAFVALAVAAMALDAGNDAKEQAKAAGGTQVSLTEFRVTPAEIAVPEGGVLNVTNNGSVVHNLAVKGEGLTTPDLKGGERAVLDVSGLDVGTYQVWCTIPGHAEAGMKGALAVGAGGHGGHGGDDEDALLANNETFDKLQKEPVTAYVAQLEQGANTEGVGNEPLAPTILPDGTKEFRLTAAITDWEVEPGKVVRAWTYNGTVPGPLIKVNPGDKVRVVLDNRLPQSTAVHFHGIETPNKADGVPFVTQDPVKPGETYVYEFVAKGPAVGMYHSHHHAERQVPNGLLGAFMVGDVPLPNGITPTQEVPMVLNDAGVIGLTLNGKSFPATAPTIAKRGDWVLIHYMNEGLQIHPMHLHGLPQYVVAKDGFPLAAPQAMDTVNVAPGERWSVLVQATEPGVWAWHCHILTHAEREDGMFGMVTTFIVQ